MKPLNLKKVERDPIEFVMTRETTALDRIMRHLNVTDLLNCRLVSHFWNKAASFVLRRRSTMIKKILGAQGLRALDTCMEQSLDFPFAGLTLKPSWKWNNGGALEFFRKYGTRFTRLRMDVSWLMELHLFFLSVFTLHLPRLSILEVKQLQRELSMEARVNLLREFRQICHGQVLKLPSLKTLRISSPCSEFHEYVLGQILTGATSPSLQIECLNASPPILGILERAGKLGAVSFIKILEDEEDNLENRLQMDQFLSIRSPSLTKLHFNEGGCLSLVGLRQILLSSQHTLKELYLTGDSVFQDSWCGQEHVFTKLTTLSLSICMDDPTEYYLFGGSSLGTNFPALKKVYLGMTYERANGAVLPPLSSRVFVVPSVTTIEIDGYVDEDGLHDLASSFPNVTKMELNYGYYSGEFMPCGRDPFEIWTIGKFKYLEKLVIWDFLIGRPTEDHLNMDSFLTGIPIEDCKRLHLNNIRFKTALRANQSILELAERLKELVVFVKPGRELVQPTKDAPFISMVSMRYALDMIPNLRAKFLYEESSLEEGDKEALEAAFKHVHGYVKLEPFFY